MASLVGIGERFTFDDGVLFLYPQRLFATGGVVSRWNGAVTRELKAACIAAAPMGTRATKTAKNAMWPQGSLKNAAFWRAESHLVGPMTRDMFVICDVPYASFVDGGTANNGTGYIYPHGDFLLLPPISIGSLFHGGEMASPTTSGGEIYRRSLPFKNEFKRVKGQPAQKFMEAGYNTVRRVHSALPPVHTVTF